MIKKTVPALLLLLAAACAAAAQSPAAREAVSALPESQAVIVINARRITNDALPRLLPAKQLADFDKGVADVLKQVKIDVRAVEYVVAGARFGETISTGATPDFGLVLRGGFNADALLSFVRMAQPGQHRPETHGGKSIDVYTIQFDTPKPDATPDPDAPAPKPQPFKLPSEIAFVSFGADELMVGTPAYVRAAVDARGGASGGRVSAQLADLALRNPDSLVSIAGELPAGLSNLLGLAGQATGNQSAASAVMNDEIKRLVDSVRQVQLTVTMGAADFGLQTTLRTDRPEDARALSGLAAMGLGAVEQQMQKEAASAKTAKAKADAQKFLGLLKSVGNDVRENEATFSISAPQATLADLARQSLAPAAKPAPKGGATPARRRPARRRG